jgi:hypothetical protein
LFLPLDLKPRHAAANRRPEIHLHLVLEIGPRLRPTRLSTTIEHAREHIAKTPAKAFLLLLARRASTATGLKARKIKATKVEWNSAATPLRTTTEAPASMSTRSPAAACIRFCRRWIDVV